MLNFSHPTVDGTGAFNNAIDWSDSNFPKDSDIETPALPTSPLIKPDDMSNINPNPPTVQFNIRHTLTGVSLFAYDKGNSAWVPVCSVPPQANPTPDVGVTQLDGTWLTGDPQKANKRQVMTQLKVIPWRLLPGQQWTAAWSGTGNSGGAGHLIHRSEPRLLGFGKHERAHHRRPVRPHLSAGADVYNAEY